MAWASRPAVGLSSWWQYHWCLLANPQQLPRQRIGGWPVSRQTDAWWSTGHAIHPQAERKLTSNGEEEEEFSEWNLQGLDSYYGSILCSCNCRRLSSLVPRLLRSCCKFKWSSSSVSSLINGWFVIESLAGLILILQANYRWLEIDDCLCSGV